MSMTSSHFILFNKPSQSSTTLLPNAFSWSILVICAIPFLLSAFGVDFGSKGIKLDPNSVAEMSKQQYVDGMFFHLTGAFHHALLEWTAFTAAIFTVVLAFSHYSITKDITTPIIGLALFFAGCMDAFHTLAAARLIEAAAPNTDLIPFTWAICRIFNALIMIFGVSIFLMKGQGFQNMGLKFVAIISLIFAIIAYAIISYCANSGVLPQTQYPDSLITRPYDVVPLLLFLFAGVYLYPKFYRKVPSLFAHALILSAIPEVVVELHMAFGSSSLFDNHFNIAHFLKIVAYVVPLLGLSLDYIRTYREQQKIVSLLEESQYELEIQKEDVERSNTILFEEVETRKKAESELEHRAIELERSNKELREFAYVASHDLQEPLRMVSSYTQLLSKRYKGQLDDTADEFINYAVDGAKRMQNLINDLLVYSRIDNSAKEIKKIDFKNAFEWAESNLEMVIGENGVLLSHDDFPMVKGDISQLGQLLQNLISNAIKFHGEKSIKIHIGIERKAHRWYFSITDNGIGIEQEYLERIFVIFQRLHNREKFEGTGIGLSVCKKIVERHSGELTVTSTVGEGSTFTFDLAAVD